MSFTAYFCLYLVFLILFFYFALLFQATFNWSLFDLICFLYCSLEIVRTLVSLDFRTLLMLLKSMFFLKRFKSTMHCKWTKQFRDACKIETLWSLFCSFASFFTKSYITYIAILKPITQVTWVSPNQFFFSKKLFKGLLILFSKQT